MTNSSRIASLASVDREPAGSTRSDSPLPHRTGRPGANLPRDPMPFNRSRKTRFRDAPALPFVPYIPGCQHDLRIIFATRDGRRNRRRRGKPSLALTVLGLLSCLGAVLANSHVGKAEVDEETPVLAERVEQLESKLTGTLARTDSEIRLASTERPGFR